VCPIYTKIGILAHTKLSVIKNKNILKVKESIIPTTVVDSPTSLSLPYFRPPSMGLSKFFVFGKYLLITYKKFKRIFDTQTIKKYIKKLLIV
jgi:hypothetical protein